MHDVNFTSSNLIVAQPPLQDKPLTASQELINDFVTQIGKTIEFLPKTNETIKPLSNAITKYRARSQLTLNQRQATTPIPTDTLINEALSDKDNPPSSSSIGQVTHLNNGSQKSDQKNTIGPSTINSQSVSSNPTGIAVPRRASIRPVSYKPAVNPTKLKPKKLTEEENEEVIDLIKQWRTSLGFSWKEIANKIHQVNDCKYNWKILRKKIRV